MATTRRAKLLSEARLPYLSNRERQILARFLDRLDPTVHKVEAVNVIKKEAGMLVGYNSDYFGFMQSLKNWLNELKVQNVTALVLGSGGASLAVQAALLDMNIGFNIVSRFKEKGDFLYTHLIRDEGIMKDHQLIINTTPIGMYPNSHDGPPIPYELITKDHMVYDLIYNPPETYLMREAKAEGAQVKNGEEMLMLQAEKSWEIWNS
jgi:shikimate dehydrogenase